MVIKGDKMTKNKCLRADLNDPFCLKYLYIKDFPQSYVTHKKIRCYDYQIPNSEKLQLCTQCIHYLHKKARRHTIPINDLAKNSKKRFSFTNFGWKKTSKEFKLLHSYFLSGELNIEEKFLFSKEDAWRGIRKDRNPVSPVQNKRELVCLTCFKPLEPNTHAINALYCSDECLDEQLYKQRVAENN